MDYCDRNTATPRREQPKQTRKAQPSELEASLDSFCAAIEQLAEAGAQIQRVMEARCFRFYLAQKEYISSPIASGVLFEDGTVALRFYTKSHSRHLAATELYHSLKECLFQHGHNGKRSIQWIDGPPLEES